MVVAGGCSTYGRWCHQGVYNTAPTIDVNVGPQLAHSNDIKWSFWEESVWGRWYYMNDYRMLYLQRLRLQLDSNYAVRRLKYKIQHISCSYAISSFLYVYIISCESVWQRVWYFQNMIFCTFLTKLIQSLFHHDSIFIAVRLRNPLQYISRIHYAGQRIFLV